MGYLVCNKCGGYYKLSEDESPEDFDNKCECGGTWEYYDSLGGRLDKTYENVRKTSNPPQEHYFIPVLLILVSIECVFSIFYGLSFIIFLGIIGLIFGLVFLLIRMRGIYSRLYPNTRKMIYILASFMFLVEGSSLVFLWFQIDYFSRAKIGIPILILLSVMCGISMILKTANPDNPQNLFDPPL